MTSVLAALSVSHTGRMGCMWDSCVGRRMADGEVDVWSLVAERVWSVEPCRWFEGAGSLNSVMSQRGRCPRPLSPPPTPHLTLHFRSFHIRIIWSDFVADFFWWIQAEETPRFLRKRQTKHTYIQNMHTFVSHTNLIVNMPNNTLISILTKRAWFLLKHLQNRQQNITF